jgi:chaperonin cofactor prefoldin
MYELKQTTILECEIEVLKEKIKKLNQEIKELKGKLCEKEQEKTAS